MEFTATHEGMITAPDGHKLAWLKDSEGNTLCLCRPGHS